MEVRFFCNKSDSRVINKTLSAGPSYEGSVRDEVDLMNPIVRVEADDLIDYNYVYIPGFKRFYDIVTKTIFREGVWDISLKVDVLMSFRGDINQLQVVVDKQSMPNNGNEYIDDGSLVAENVMFQQIYEYPNGFNSAGEYILITAG